MTNMVHNEEEFFERINRDFESIAKGWLLRMESDSFIMVIHKSTGVYVNLYTSNYRSESILKSLTKHMEKHKNYN